MKAGKPVGNVKTPVKREKVKNDMEMQYQWGPVKPGRARQGREGPVRAMKSQTGQSEPGKARKGRPEPRIVDESQNGPPES